MYEPESLVLQRVKSRIGAQSWERRVDEARGFEAEIKKVLDEVKQGASLNEAIEKHLPPERRSWAIRRIPQYRQHGFEGLIDRRTPREPTVTMRFRELIRGERTVNPRVTTDEVLEKLASQEVGPLPSESTIKREFARVDCRRGPVAKKEETEVVDLPFAGGELLLAAEIETGAIQALTKEVEEIGNEAKEAAQGQEPKRDVGYRDEEGHFTAEYNHRRRKEGDEIPEHLRSAAEKAVGRVPTWPRFVHEGSETLDAKLRMLVMSWMVATTKGWESLRAPNVASLETLTGFAYMPATLAKFVSALAISGAGPRLLERAGQHWHQVAEAHFQDPGAMAAIYIDNHAKEVWTSLFTQCGKVSHRNRVMPCITTTYAHTGAGTPMVLSVQSGSAPLAPRLPSLVDHAEQLTGTEVERVTVIDAEGSTFDVLDSFIKRKRVIVTPLRPSRAPNLELSYGPGSYFRPYRDNDELRVASCTLRHKTSGRSLELGALIVRRENRESDTVLLTNGLALGMEGRDLADLYFRRWPVQENAFKEGAAAVGLNQHRGNCGRMVANVAVITEMEKLAKRIARNEDALKEAVREGASTEAKAMSALKEDVRAQAAVDRLRIRLEGLEASGAASSSAALRIAEKYDQAVLVAEGTAEKATLACGALERNKERIAKLRTSLAEDTARRDHLEPQRTIRQLDVAQDEILTATKLTALQLISFVLRMYLGGAALTAKTFESRVFTTRGRKEIGSCAERIIFYENPRDPEITDALRVACAQLNERKLQREARELLYAVEPAPSGVV